MDTGLQGKVVLITGAATGIGRATAVAFAREGATLALADYDGDELGRTAELVGRRSRRSTLPWRICRRARESTRRSAPLLGATDGRLDVLFNNVGKGAVRSFDDLSDADWEATLQVNFMSQVRAIRHALVVMRAQGHGVITNNASDLARQPEGVPIDYSVSKAAVLSLTKAWPAPRVRRSASMRSPPGRSGRSSGPSRVGSRRRWGSSTACRPRRRWSTRCASESCPQGGLAPLRRSRTLSSSSVRRARPSSPEASGGSTEAASATSFEGETGVAPPDHLVIGTMAP